MKIQWNGLCPRCNQQIELVRELPDEVIRQIIAQATPSPIAEPASGNLPKEAVEPAPQIDSVDSEWLKETLQIIKWKPPVALSWIKAQLKVEGTDLMEVLNSLPVDKLRVFVDHISLMRDASGASGR